MANTQAMRRKAYPGHKEAHNEFYYELNTLSGAYEEAKDLAAVDPEGISDAEEISKKVIILGKKMRKHFTEMKQMKHEKSLVFTLSLEKAGQRGGKYLSRKKVKGKWVYTYPEEGRGERERPIMPVSVERVKRFHQATIDDLVRKVAEDEKSIAYHEKQSEKLHQRAVEELDKQKKERLSKKAKQSGRDAGAQTLIKEKRERRLVKLRQLVSTEKSLVFTLPLQKAQQKTLTGGHQSDSWDRRLKNLVLVPPPAPLERDLSKETKKNKKKLKEILGTPLDVQYGVQQPQ